MAKSNPFLNSGNFQRWQYDLELRLDNSITTLVDYSFEDSEFTAEQYAEAKTQLFNCICDIAKEISLEMIRQQQRIKNEKVEI